ncbi:hypothetical protein KY290_007856 [Solanum tuberosum]|uniref:Retrovirus-related Pol polyprotein from transposon TNT 1-94 n=1 Tax=Solanum tuberosum TaxID=4113 RepID=A0ABQ7W8X4_SOLTU|nr:hypothetical protein KY290_007856 [Solanum tuberosum]
MNDHITSFNKLATDLRNMDVTFTDGDMALMLLSSLPDEFEHLETTLLHGNDEVSLKEVYSALYCYEQRKREKQRRRSRSSDCERSFSKSYENVEREIQVKIQTQQR